MAFAFRFLIVLLAMLVAGIFGYMLARSRGAQDSRQTSTTMSAEIVKMRRRASAAEAAADAAQARLSRERRRGRRRRA